MGVFDEIVGQPRALAILKHALRRGTAHAYLFSGPRGVGKKEAALAFAAALLCPDRGCGCCHACRRVLGGVHPDLVVLAPEGRFIMVDDIRQVNRDVFRRPYEAMVRVHVLLDAETMNKEAANALLKTLEEPPAHACFILVTSEPQRLLPTIVSRCQKVPFVNIPPEPLASYLVQRYRLPSQYALELARVAQGDLEYARTLVESPAVREARLRLLSCACSLAGASFSEQLAMVDDLVAFLEERQNAALARVESEKSRVLDWVGPAARSQVEKSFKERINREKWASVLAGIDEVTRTIASWYRDLAAVVSGAEEAVHNVDYLDELRLQALPGLAERYLLAVEVARRVKERFRYNVDTRCAMEDLIFSLKEALL